MKNIIVVLIFILTTNLYGQCGRVYINGVRKEIPCDWNYLEYAADSLRIQETLFIKHLNEERIKRNLSPLVFDQTLYDNVAIPQAKKMAGEAAQSHTTANVYECVCATSYRYGRTNIGFNSVENFQWVGPNQSFSVHWRILMKPSLEKIAVRMEIAPTESNEKNGWVYVCVDME